jgi:hypothetical protein
VHIEFAHDVSPVQLHGIAAESELPRHLVIRQASAQKGEKLLLALGQHLRKSPRLRAQPLSNLLHHLREKYPALNHLVDRLPKHIE